MKIEDSPFQFNGASPVEKLRRNAAQSSFDATLDDLDLSFIELLSSLSPDANHGILKGISQALDKSLEKAPVKKSELEKSGKVTQLPLQARVSKTEDGDFNTDVDSDMTLTQDDLSLLDIQYLKQEVIPGLPILLGSVPFNTVFPTGSGGEISYKGFDVSPKLAELIEKGYKTGRPIRLELDATSALVLKFRNGQVSAEFVSADKAGAFVMQQELDELRNRMAARNLPVGTLEYKYQNPGQKRRDSSEDRDKPADKD